MRAQAAGFNSIVFERVNEPPSTISPFFKPPPSGASLLTSHAMPAAGWPMIAAETLDLAAAFPIEVDDSHTVAPMRGEDSDGTASSPIRRRALEARFANASPDVKTRISKGVERGPIGAAVKRANGHRSQICEAVRFQRAFSRRTARRTLRRIT